MAFGSLTRPWAIAGSLSPELVEELLHQNWIELDPRGSFTEERRKLPVVAVARLPAVSGPVVQKRLVRRKERPCRRGRAALLVLECESSGPAG